MFGRSAAGAWDASKRDEARVRRGFWPKLKRVAAKLPFAEDLLAAYYAAFDRQTPLQVKAALLGALAYFVLPVDAMVLVTAIRMVSGHIRDEHREAARDALARNLNDVR